MPADKPTKAGTNRTTKKIMHLYHDTFIVNYLVFFSILVESILILFVNNKPSERRERKKKKRRGCHVLSCKIKKKNISN